MLVGLLLPARAEGSPRLSPGAAPADGLRDGEVVRAEKVLARLAQMRIALAEGGGALRPGSLFRRYYPALFVAVAELRESELKTELDTAVFMYERLLKSDSDAAADCARERQDTYRPLCENLRGATARRLLWVKAGLHARWAEALVRKHRGATDAETRSHLERLAAARASDLEIAGRVLRNCERAGALLAAHPLVGTEGEGGRGFRGWGPEADGEVARALYEARRLAASLPRSPLWYRMSNAVSAYEDGLFWLRRLEQSTSRVVSARGSAAIALRELGITDEAAGRAVRANFRTARAYATASGELLGQLLGRPGRL